MAFMPRLMASRFGCERREGGDHIVALEPLVYAELLRFVADLKERN
jgi:hypothetical protein